MFCCESAATFIVANLVAGTTWLHINYWGTVVLKLGKPHPEPKLAPAWAHSDVVSICLRASKFNGALSATVKL